MAQLRCRSAVESRLEYRKPLIAETGRVTCGCSFPPPPAKTTRRPADSAQLVEPLLPLRQETASLCLGWPDRSRDVSPYFLGHPDRIGPKSVVTM